MERMKIVGNYFRFTFELSGDVSGEHLLIYVIRNGDFFGCVDDDGKLLNYCEFFFGCFEGGYLLIFKENLRINFQRSK